MSNDVANSLALTHRELAAIDALAVQFVDDHDHRNRIRELGSAIERQQTKTIARILESGMASHGAAYPLLLITQSLDAVFTLYRRFGITDEVRDATLADVRRWVDEHAARFGGEFGLSQVFWFARHLSCRILQLGSLQYEPKRFDYPYRIYRSPGSASILVVAEPGLRCDAAGYLEEQDPAFVTALEEDGATLCAHAVDATIGRISAVMSSYRLSDLELLCNQESEILNVHIPKGVAFSSEAVDASQKRAVEHFPSYDIFVCTSWLLDPALGAVLEGGSNIIRFMERFSKFPVTFSKPQLYERVFGFGLEEDEVRSCAAQTRLQRRVQEALATGVVFRTMGGFIVARGASCW
jgi:hypothetical protein